MVANANVEIDRVLVIGGGPAGMFAAITAASELGTGGRVLLLDNNVKLGRKLAVTGNGRCNLTNADLSIEHYHGRDPQFARNVLARFSNRDLLARFEGLGVEFRQEEGGRYFPVTNQASTIVDNLREELDRTGVEIVLQAKVVSVRRGREGGFEVASADGRSWKAGAVVVATGGPTHPRLGATADGHAIAASFGHAIVEPLPCLTGFETHDRALFDLQGVQTIVEVTCRQGGRKVRSLTGEILFTHYGVSGPVVFDLSPFVVRGITDQSTEIRANFFPGLKEEEVEEKIAGIWTANPTRNLGNSLIGILPRKLVRVLLGSVMKTDLDTAAANVPKSTRREIARLLTGLPIRLKAPRPFEDAQVTDGGVETTELDPRTMESKKVPGLFFAGEVLDVHGDCGGYNLQFAFSSGRAAGLAAAVTCG